MDQKIATKRAYDLAAEKLSEHISVCDECRSPFDDWCAIGQPLLKVENDAWSAYREVQR